MDLQLIEDTNGNDILQQSKVLLDVFALLQQLLGY